MSVMIDNVPIPKIASFDLAQSYEPMGGESVLRTYDGTGHKQTTWSKTRIKTSGMGWIPAGLQEIDTKVPHVLHCSAPRLVSCVFASREAVLPVGRRSDAGYQPYGLALLSNGQIQRAAVSLMGDSATVDEVDGAVAYKVGYRPVFTVWVAKPTEPADLGSAQFSWELVCEEV